MLLKKADLHVHVLQCLYPEDIYELAIDHYKEINWNRFNFLDKYEKNFGTRLHPVKMFEKAEITGDLSEIRDVACYKFKGNGNFDEFSIKSYFSICVAGFYLDNENPEPVLKCITERHKREGLTYVEYRNGFGGSGQEWKDWHARFARFFKEASTKIFTAKYIVRLGNYTELKEMLDENPDLVDTVVGVDFSGREIAPEKLLPFYKEIENDRRINPSKTVDVVVHIGESFEDKSLETAIRWCHQSALFGAKRLAHCIALGINPSTAILRYEEAYTYEKVEDRIAQIRYDIEHEEMLRKYNVSINITRLNEELAILEKKNGADNIFRPYDIKRLEDIEGRQRYVLDELSRLETTIEVCPTSNLCISGISSIKEHPFLRLYESDVNIVICTDDPGVFESSLSDEIDFIISHFNISAQELSDRLGNPIRFRLKADK